MTNFQILFIYMFHLIHCTGTDGQQSGGNLPKKLDPCSYQTNKTQLRVGAKAISLHHLSSMLVVALD